MHIRGWLPRIWNVRAVAFFLTCIFLIGTLDMARVCIAEEKEPEKVPIPQISENHNFNVSGEGGGVKWTRNEEWGITMLLGNVRTGISVMNLTQTGYMQNNTWTSCQYNVQHNIGSSVYIAQCSFGIEKGGISFQIGNQTLWANLTTCRDFALMYSPITYNGPVPEFDLNITFYRIWVYSGATMHSTFDLTLKNHIRLNWSRTDIKIEALFDLTDTRFYDITDTEYKTGELFTTELVYTMECWNATDQKNQQPLMPTGYNNQSMNYDLKLANGKTLTVSRLNMNNNYTVFYDGGNNPQVGYSAFEYNWRSAVTHGFPNLTYKHTKSILSDPEITVFHDKVTARMKNDINDRPVLALVAIVGVIIGITCTAFFAYRRYHRKKRGI